MTTIEIEGHRYAFDERSAIDISIHLDFDGPQPSAYDVERAASTACEYGTLVGDTRRGGSCNFERITLIPHCNGTHTECVGHITHERISVLESLDDVFIPAKLISVAPSNVGGDLVIGDGQLLDAGVGPPANSTEGKALVVRTLPNGDDKLAARYDESNIPAYFSSDAMELIVAAGFKHLLVDLPSIDRLFDGGKLVNHRSFWNIEQGSYATSADARLHNTVTELIYVPNHVADGDYLLNLQVAPFESDAAPSRPVVFKTL